MPVASDTMQHASRITRILLLLAISFGTARAGAPADSLVDAAWHAWDTGNQPLVAANFLKALRLEPENTRALLGLSLLYRMQTKYDEAWSAFVRILPLVRDRAPYLYAAWDTPMMSKLVADTRTHAYKTVKDLREHVDGRGTIQAMATAGVLNSQRQSAPASELRKLSEQIGAVTEWMIIGPFENVSASGHDKRYPPELSFDPNGSYFGKNDVPTQWITPGAMPYNSWMNFSNYFDDADAVYYANTFVYAPEPQRVEFRFGTAGLAKAYVDDTQILDITEERQTGMDMFTMRLQLTAGWHRVLVKCGMAEYERAGFILRITDSNGAPVPDLRISKDLQTYTPGTPLDTAGVEHFAIAYFNAQIAAHPERLENYLLLADCHIDNGNGTDAELTLRRALRIAPNSPPLLERLADAYSTSGKDDEMNRTFDRLEKIDAHVPSALMHKFAQLIKTEQLARAEAIADTVEAMLPASEQSYAMRIALYRAKGMDEKVEELTAELDRRFTGNADYTLAYARIVEHSTRQPSAVIALLDNFLRFTPDNDVLAAKAHTLLSIPDIEGWREIYDRLIETAPAYTGYYTYMAEVYFGMRNYGEAEALIRRALRIRPNSGRLLRRLAEIHRIQGNKEVAADEYNRALRYRPTDYDTRATLNELQGRKSPFERFAPIDIDSTIERARAMQSDAEQGAVVVLDCARHVIYEGGAFESNNELVVKVLNGRGIDDWKEYSIPANRYNEELIVETAVAVKPDGTETKADVDGGYVVFKALEQNDVVHIKWRTKSHYSGKLARHFFDTYYFNGYYPAQDVRYEILAPKSFHFNYRTQNIDVKPVISETADGTLYTWAAHDIPEVSFEYGMPTLDDVGSVLFVSSLDGWENLVEWYRDIAETKTRGSYEITEQVQQLLDGKEHASDEEKMRAVYDFITENIRYSSIEFRQGAYVPQKARDVLVNRIGDCKDMATLCIAMLREAGLTAHFVLVNTRDEGSNRNALPAVVFNHCIVAVETSAGLKYLDLTANNYPIGSIPQSDIDAFALVIKPGVTGPTRLPGGGIPRTMTVRMNLALDAQNGLVGTCATVGTGTAAAAIRDYFRDQPKREQEKQLLESLSHRYAGSGLGDLTFENLENLAPSASYAYHFDVENYLAEAGSFKILKMPWNHPAEAEEALSYEKRQFPYEYFPLDDTITEEITMEMPPGYEPIELPAPKRLASRVAEYTLSYTYAGRKLVARRSYIAKLNVVETDEYAEFKAFHNQVVKEDARLILLKRKGR